MPLEQRHHSDSRVDTVDETLSVSVGEVFSSDFQEELMTADWNSAENVGFPLGHSMELSSSVSTMADAKESDLLDMMWNPGFDA